uniref:INO80 complex subunit E n=1 Tax=Lates calcarifer TaxID=8187 RepID=A0A4W6C5U4_LATCA
FYIYLHKLFPVALLEPFGFLFQEQECFQEELRRAQRKLLKVSRDKSFLLDRLLQYERVDEDSSDSEATVSSENSEGEGPRERERERDGAKKRRSSPGACLPSSSSPHLSLLSRPGVNPLQSSGSGPYLNTVSFCLHFLHFSAASNSNIAAIVISSSANIIPVLIWHYLYNLFCHFIHKCFISSFVLCLTSVTASLSLHCSFFCVCFLCFSASVFLVNSLCLCACVFVWSFGKTGACVCVGQMPFPPEYLAPPAERMKKERKTKAPKNKKETTGKVVAPMAANYSSAPSAPQTASGPFSWVPRQMLSGDAAEEEGESDGDSDRGDEDRGEGDEAELVIDIPNE